MRIPLHEQESTPALARFTATLPAHDSTAMLAYRTRTGATLSIGGLVAGAFDREHHGVVVEPASRERAIVLEVERFSLPTNRLPSGDGLRWKAMVRSAHETPQPYLDLIAVTDRARRGGGRRDGVLGTFASRRRVAVGLHASAP